MLQNYKLSNRLRKLNKSRFLCLPVAKIGIGIDLDELYNALDRDPLRMGWFANGLSEVWLEKRQEVIQEV
ncbi:FAD dependent oxidoreductase [Penicillium robsamsonii]|uniref:FAD dependent oxidoreductase n=1 Tax=Penicillium robsamsonii TaxID=1792511 RepID=UPI0025488132|nr:FAD dependent oxidoreductase [Penicillium robsamsonii]KAJ5817891.1 FAD dependent oxidoreductase [Penicillium robsamsonii]